MEKTPNALRKHVVLLGHTNSGKSTLFNALTGQDRSIVAAQAGTTTDPVQAAMELIPYGPVVLVDTAGLGDDSDLGAARMKRTKLARRRADAALYVADIANFCAADYTRFQAEKLPHLLVFTKVDLVAPQVLAQLQEGYPQAFFLSPNDVPALALLRTALAELLATLEPEDSTILGDLLPPLANVIMVVPVDSEAPKGRLILPQVQLIRDCLDHGIKCFVTREKDLASALESLAQVDLVVTDSQAFSFVNSVLPPGLPLTSFSMLLARQKGNFNQLMAGVAALQNLPDGACILMLEGCTHNHTHEDIGRVKIPAMLEKKLGKRFAFDFRSGYDFPDDLTPYQFAVQCGNCMLNRREALARLEIMTEQKLPVSNYGILLAWGSGILERSTEIFRNTPKGS